jgi:hypothetical protein
MTLEDLIFALKGTLDQENYQKDNGMFVHRISCKFKAFRPYSITSEAQLAIDAKRLCIDRLHEKLCGLYKEVYGRKPVQIAEPAHANKSKQNVKDLAHNYLQSFGIHPDIRFTQEGLSHDQTFTCYISFVKGGDPKKFTGKGRSRSIAKEQACKNIMDYYENPLPPAPKPYTFGDVTIATTVMNDDGTKIYISVCESNKLEADKKFEELCMNVEKMSSSERTLFALCQAKEHKYKLLQNDMVILKTTEDEAIGVYSIKDAIKYLNDC